MIPLTKEIIFGYDDLPKTKLEVPEWGGFVFLRSLTAGESMRLSELHELHNGNIPMKDMLAVLSHCVVDEKNNPIFPKEEEAVDGLLTKNMRVIQYLLKEINKLNSITIDKIEDEEKKS